MATRPVSNDEPFRGMQVVVTGASDGIGRAAAHAYVAGGADVVMVGRNEAKTAAAARRIMTETGRRAVTWEIADLAEQSAVRDLAARLLDRLPRLHVLANNAGAMFLERTTTSEGFERTFALNHLGYFTLTLLLLERLAASASPGRPARVLNVSSRAHENARLDLADLQLTRGFGGWRAYANSKLCNVLFTASLAARVDPARVVTHALHPGVVSTRFATNNGTAGRLLRRLMDVVSIDAAGGADTLVWLSHAPDALARDAAENGAYWVKRRRKRPSRAARNPDTAEAMWTASASLAGVDANALVRAAMAVLPRAT